MSARKATPATAQGSLLWEPRASRMWSSGGWLSTPGSAPGPAYPGGGAAPARANPAAPTAVPQRWQNRAPGVSAAPHDAHVAPASEAPQFEQNRPDAGAPQFGQGADSVRFVIGGM